MKHSLQVNRLKIMSRGASVYDQKFHEGVNIIRGQNGSGKSTIADFIFFALGGEFDDWKDSATRCEEVQCEVETPSGKLTIRRQTESKTSPAFIFFGEMEKASQFALEGWQRFPIRRNSTDESFSQVLFRSLGIPEAQSQGASNITMHQVLRLCYSDQRTPAPRLFRFESFDTQNIREAVGDLVCGISGYDLYESNLKLRDLEKSYSDVNTSLSGLLKALPPDDALRTTASIHTQMNDLKAEKEQLEEDIKSIDEEDNVPSTSEYLKQRKLASKKLSKNREELRTVERKIEKIELDRDEIRVFQSYLTELNNKLSLSESTLNLFGSIEFTHCPSCGSAVKDNKPEGCCILCSNPISPDEEKSRYNQIKADLEIQFRESKQLLNQKQSDLNDLKKRYRALHASHESDLSIFDLKYSGPTGPREAFLAGKTNRIGQISAELEFLTRSLSIASEVDELERKRGEIHSDISKLRKRIEALERQSQKRRSAALSEISETAVSLLHSDCKRQEEFETAKKVQLSFLDDAIAVDGKMSFAESSNVFLKNAAILSIFLSAGKDENFYHPGFLLLDNIEDKGMEVERSHLFQRLIVERATALEVPFQIIFTTSMMNPDLELEDYVIGPSYTRENKTLNFSKPEKK